MDKRTELYLRFVVPMKVRLRNLVTYWLSSALDRLDIERCTRYHNSVTFRDFLNDDELFLFSFDDDEDLF